MKLTQMEEIKFRQHIQELLLEDSVWKLDKYIQHGQTTRLEHSIAVAYFSYWLHKRVHLKSDERSLIRGALLHDFFLYDLHEERPHKHVQTHPEFALSNALALFMLNDIEEDIIQNHMWPLTPTTPRYSSTVVVSLVDKACAIAEFAHFRYQVSLKAIGDDRVTASVTSRTLPFPTWRRAFAYAAQFRTFASS